MLQKSRQTTPEWPMSGGRRKYWSESGGELGRGSGERGGNGGEEGGGGELKEVGEGQRGCALMDVGAEAADGKRAGGGWKGGEEGGG